MTDGCSEIVGQTAVVAVRGPLTDLLPLIHRRRPARGGNIEVLGNAEPLDFRLERVGSG